MVRVIGFVSGKGGVGKTTLVSNLGVSLVQEGYDVAVVDANITGANLGLHYGFISYPISLNDVVEGDVSLTDAMYRHSSGVDIIPASLSFEDVLNTKSLDIKEEIQKSLSHKDFVLVDAATGLDRETINAIDMSDELVLVTHPELPTISDALRTKSIAKKRGKEFLGVVLNRVNKKDELKKEYLSAFFELPVIGVIKEDHTIRKSIEKKNPLILENPSHKISREFKKISYKIMGKDFKARSSIFDRIVNATRNDLNFLIESFKSK